MKERLLILTPEKAKELESTYRVVRRSIDARQRTLKVNLTLLTDDNEQPIPIDAPIPLYTPPVFQDVHHAKQSVTIVGAGPAGLFAALTLLEHGIKPIIYERGKEVSERKKDIALLNRNEAFDSESNYCFGEGGAGTFSDGKLFSRSKKRGNMQHVMELFHFFGAPDTVLYETHAHIGSDKLPTIIKNIRECILAHGGEIHFGERWKVESQKSKVESQKATILAIGHSAHDTYRELAAAGVALEAKGCAMGVRVEHPQSLINEIFYHLSQKSKVESQKIIDLVGNASYSLVTQVQIENRTSIVNRTSVNRTSFGVYSFCMCPGGHIVPATSEAGACVVNGMSASHRNSPYANSGIVVELHPDGRTAIEWLAYQETLERAAYKQAQPSDIRQRSGLTSDSAAVYSAPAQRLRDFVEGKESKTLPPCSYLPGIVPSRLDQWLPVEIGQALQQGFRDFDRKYPGFLTNEAVILGVESRSSSPIRIVRDAETMQSISHPWLYPCGEGAGYAGGITSSALDGIHAAEAAVISSKSSKSSKLPLNPEPFEL